MARFRSDLESRLLTMTSRAALLAGATLALLAAAGCRPPPPPNIVLIIGDDLGYPDHGFTGSTIVQTPHLDQLAAEGTVFRNGFNSASTCRPSHITLLTGLHPAQWEASNASHGIGSRRRPFEWISKFDTLPRKLRAAG